MRFDARRYWRGHPRPRLGLLLAAWCLGALRADASGGDRVWAFAVGSLLLAFGAAFPRGRGLAALGLAGFAGYAALAGNLSDAQRAGAWVGVRGVFEGRVVRVERAAWGDRTRLCEVLHLGRAARRVPGCIELRTDPRESVGAPFAQHGPGDRVRVSLLLRAVGGLRNPGSGDPARRRAREGIGLSARLTHPALHARVGQGLVARLHRLRVRVAEGLVASGSGGALLAALGLGARGHLAPSSVDAFRSLGASHLLAVSGLHVGLVALVVYAITGWIVRRAVPTGHGRDARVARLVFTLLGTTAFGLLAGWGVPVRRALLLLMVWTLVQIRGRATGRFTPLLVAAAGVLVFEPAALFSPGAQLSFAACAALLGGPSSSGAVGLLRVSATALLATAPIAAFHFGARAPAALAANALLVPWTSAVLLPAALTCVVVLGFDLEPLRHVVGWGEGLAGATLAVVEAVAARGPVTPSAGAGPSGGAIVVASVVALLALRSETLGARVAGALVVSLGLSVAPAARFGPPVPRLLLLDVGHGDAVLVQGERGVMLVDAGARLPGGGDLGRHVVVPTLGRLGIARIDLFVVSHADIDHQGGVASVLAGLEVGELWIPFGGVADAAFAPTLAAARRAGVPIHERGLGSLPRELGDLRVVPLWPPGAPAATRNDGSLVVRVEVAGQRVLLAGDVEAAGEAGLLASGVSLEAEVLKLPHHGSRTSSSAAWLDAVTPALAIASAPCRSRFGLPHRVVEARLRERGTPLWWTGAHGAVWVPLAPRLAAWGVGSSRECPRPDG